MVSSVVNVADLDPEVRANVYWKLLGVQILFRREELKLSQEDLSEKTGIPASTIDALEQGRDEGATTDIREIMKLIWALDKDGRLFRKVDVSMDDVYSGKNDQRMKKILKKLLAMPTQEEVAAEEQAVLLSA